MDDTRKIFSDLTQLQCENEDFSYLIKQNHSDVKNVKQNFQL